MNPLKTALADTFNKEELSRMVGSFDVVGDIAITIIPPELVDKQELIGEAILNSNKRIRVVAKRSGHYNGEHRTLPVQIIAGEDRKETTHKENGITLQLNVETVYYTVRMAGERRRVAGCIQPGEKIAVLCSGVGPFPLVMARHSQAAEIYGIEKNPAAHDYALRNLAANKSITNVKLLHGDAETLLPSLGVEFDRVVVVLPKDGEFLLSCALRGLKTSGWLHFYTMEQNPANGIEKVRNGCRKADRHLCRYTLSACGHCAPKTNRLCINAHIE